MKKLPLLLTAVGALLAGVGAASAQALVLDTGRVVRESAAFQAARPQLQAKGKAIEDRKNAYEAQFNKENSDLEQQAKSGVTSQDVIRSKAQDLQKRAQAADDDIKRQAAEFQRVQNYMLEQLGDQVQKISDEILRQRNAQVVVRADAAIAVNPAVDISSQVLTALNQRLPTVSLTPPTDTAAPTPPPAAAPKKK